MKETNRFLIWQSILPGAFRKAFHNPGLKEVLVALEETLKGGRVLITCSGDFFTGDDWQVASLFPGNPLHIPGNYFRNKRLLGWSLTAPHLFRPVKTIYAGENSPFWLRELTDLVYGHDFQQRSRNVNVKDIPVLGKHLASVSGAFAFQEMQVNISRLMVEFLKEIWNLGGTVLNQAKAIASGRNIVVTDLLTGETKSCLCENFFPGDVHYRKLLKVPGIPWPGFSMKVKLEGMHITLAGQEELSVMMVPDAGEEDAAGVFCRIFDNSPGQVSYQLIPDCGLEALMMKIPGKLKGYRISTAPTITEGSPVEDHMESAYDLAKQTGIAFRAFRRLYYRYGTGLGWITDRAYKHMESTRDILKIWEMAENDYVSKFEWGKIPLTKSENLMHVISDS